MMDSRFQIHKLSETETVKSFDCGDDDLNDFILNEASLYRKAKLAVTYVVIDVSKNEVVAYFSLANDKVSVAEFTNRTEFNRFRKKRFVNDKRIKGYPAVKLCRLAVVKSARGLHLGTFLIDFIKSFFIDDNKTGCRFVTVDAYLDAVDFYAKTGFELLNEYDADAQTRLLFFDLESI